MGWGVHTSGGLLPPLCTVTCAYVYVQWYTCPKLCLPVLRSVVCIYIYIYIYIYIIYIVQDVIYILCCRLSAVSGVEGLVHWLACCNETRGITFTQNYVICAPSHHFFCSVLVLCQLRGLVGIQFWTIPNYEIWPLSHAEELTSKCHQLSFLYPVRSFLTLCKVFFSWEILLFTSLPLKKGRSIIGAPTVLRATGPLV